MTIKDLKEYLDTLPEDAEVVTAVERQIGYEAFSKFEPAVIDDNIYFDGFRLELGDI